MKTTNRTSLILRHELLHTIRGTGFIILTLSLPVLALLAVGVFHIVSGAAKPPAQAVRMGYVDEAGGFDRFTSQGWIELVRFGTREAATQALLGKVVTEYFVIPRDFVSTGTVSRFMTRRELAPAPATAAAIKSFISRNLLAGKLPEDVAARIDAPVTVQSITLDATGAPAREQGGYGNFIIPSVFSMLLALAVIFSSMYVLQSLSEEKESRLMEVLLSSVSTRQLLAGKLLGRGAAGLAQVIVWVVSIPLLRLASSSIGGFLHGVEVPGGVLALGVVYFILGYALFAVLSACVAAIGSSVREAQAIAPLYTLFAIAPFWFLSLIMIFPASPVWVFFSIFPFSAPVLVMLRLGITGVPPWQLAASIAVLSACIAGGLLLAARLLRLYLLSYGRRPSLGKIIQSIGIARAQRRRT
jgi:ABC-2 type transport system permease protein